MRFIGRKSELGGLKWLFGKRVASFVVIRGRRRIGKSRLCEEFAKEFDQAFFFSGLAPDGGTSAQSQRQEFARQMKEARIPNPWGDNDWGHLFSSVAHQCTQGRSLVVLDEITWMGSKDPTFLGKLKTAWDMYFKQNDQMILVISGSNSAWIEKNLLSSTGFVGRVSWRLTLDELPLSDCGKFWQGQDEHVSAYEKLKFLSVTGGVPRYLEELEPSLSAEENIRRLCFCPEGFLVHEFDDIFSDLFDQRSDQYRKLVTGLSGSALTASQLAKQLGRSRGGDLTASLDELCEAGFVAGDYSWSLKDYEPSKIIRYRLRDNYVRFYLRYIAPRKGNILSGELRDLPPGWQSILGLQFENLVINNRRQLHDLLRIPSNEIMVAGPYLQRRFASQEGVQIDFLIQTRFSTLYVCEIKFQREPIGASVIPEIQTKIDRLKRSRAHSIRPVLIHVNGVTDELLSREYFAHVVDFSDFLLSSQPVGAGS